MLALHRNALLPPILAAFACLLLYLQLGDPKPLDSWKWMDILGEGGTALLSAIWLLLVLASRPGGRVTGLLAGGLALIMLGAWIDCLDEFFMLPKQHLWDNWLESLLMPGGMLVLTAGLYFWRQEQFSLNEHMRKRERVFRDHRSFDRLTQLANADYLRRQIRLERRRRPDEPCALILLDLDGAQQIVRRHGSREGDRLLQAVSHLLLLNLRQDDLLCRYAGDRYAILLPATGLAEAQTMSRGLERAVASLRHHPRDGGAPAAIASRCACALADDAAPAQIDELFARLDAAVETSVSGSAVAA